jgi:hypothetical protein
MLLAPGCSFICVKMYRALLSLSKVDWLRLENGPSVHGSFSQSSIQLAIIGTALRCYELGTTSMVTAFHPASTALYGDE